MSGGSEIRIRWIVASLACGICLSVLAPGPQLARAQSPADIQGPSTFSGPQGIIGGRPGPSPGRYQPGMSAPPRTNYGTARTDDVGRPAPFPESRNALNEAPSDKGDIRPWIGLESGITLDEAVQIMLRNNLDLKVQYSEICQAEADVTTASLRANPIVYMDSQQIPYGSFAPSNASGPIQYDVNIVHPLDVSGKRRTRTASAQLAREAVAVQFRNAVRLQIDNVYRVYVDALVAQRNFELAEGGKVKDDAAAAFTFDGADEINRAARQNLALLLNVPASYIQSRQLHGRVLYTCQELPLSTSELIDRALRTRPDLIAQRLNIQRAEADVAASKANRLDDLQLLYQPYTFHDGRTAGERNNLAWAVGVTVPMPIYNRQQGNIRKAELIADQMRTQYASLRAAVIADVEAAVLEHESAYKAYLRAKKDVQEPELGASVRSGEIRGTARDVERLVAVVNKLRTELYNDRVMKFGEAITRHRRSMLRVDTAVGERVVE